MKFRTDLGVCILGTSRRTRIVDDCDVEVTVTAALNTPEEVAA
jgi:hypothetical protein